MAQIVKEILNLHDYALEHWKDPRSDDWFLMQNIWGVLAILGVYLYFVLSLGPKLMEKRKPFNIDKILIVYNTIQVISCAVLVVLVSIYLLPYYKLRCEPCDYSDSFRGTFAAKLTWWYFILKVIDLLDTLFFVVKKNNNQITFLHVYHHAGMVILTWMATKFINGGSALYIGYLNSMVHMAMYSYYLLTVWNKKYKSKIWLKKAITQLQIMQFSILLIMFLVILLTEDCGFPKWICMVMIPQNFFMMALFADFYYNAYILPRRAAKKNK